MSHQLDQYELDPVFGCHLWTGKVSSTSKRPIVWRGRTPTNAYVIVFEKAYGPVPNGMQVEHWCRRILCIRAEHLEAVTPRENGLRKSWAYRARMKRCPRGHDLSDAMVTPEMGRLCRSCMQ